MSKALLIDMFDNMVRRKDASVIPHYYDPEFVLTTNGQSQAYEAFVESHERVYSTSIRYGIRYDESTWVEVGDCVAVRCWISIASDGDAAREIEVMLIAKYRGGRIHQLWELTWPDWSAMKALDTYTA